MGGILVGVLAAVRRAHRLQDLIIVVLPVCPVQVESRRYFWLFASGNCIIGMTGLTSWVGYPDLEPFGRLEFFPGRKNRPSLTGFLKSCSHRAFNRRSYRETLRLMIFRSKKTSLPRRSLSVKIGKFGDSP
ncbi:hypothetical protein CRX42_01845 [Pseudomonas jessenii]|uniref:Uncharacterized protein n=1 Tax=Pseudomonas jessenii TaxID=77298 RepID=A0A2W0EV62_PSEJE|nr:hypothetical protein CRX42_01845 [Pseudomonas jessenii]